MKQKIYYLSRIFKAYAPGSTSQLSFWHGRPEINPFANYDKLGHYYQKFFYKAEYSGPFDENGIPLLNYHGKIGKQYNPIAIAQFGLGHYNLCRLGNKKNCRIFLKMADFLVDTIEKNESSQYVWHHHFDWDYRGKIKAPWYSGLAQGAGISLLARAYNETGIKKYKDTFELAFEAMITPIEQGGCTFIDENKDPWIEEMIVSPVTHILNGFLWSLFSVFDLFLLTNSQETKSIFCKYARTIEKNLFKFDAKIWSFYDLTNDKMLASLFYHRLHIVQLEILHKMTHNPAFLGYSEKWHAYLKNDLNKTVSMFYKALFKLLKY